MSELIDRIYDVEKISKEVNDILTEINKAVGGIDAFKKAVEDLEKTTRKAKGTEDLVTNTKLLNDTVIKGGVEMKRYEAEVQKLKDKTDQLTTSEKAASIEIAKARLELQAAQKEVKAAAIAEIELTSQNKNLVGSYNALVVDLKKSIDAFKALSGEEAKSAQGKELLKKIQDTQNALKGSDAAMGNYQRNVGNYGQALEKLPGIFGEMASKGESVLVSLRTKFESVKDATMQYKEALVAQREAQAIAMAAAERAAIAETALKEAEASGAVTSGLAAEAELARAAATTTATVATEAGATAMKILKIAIASTGIGLLVVALGAVVTYFTSTNEGAKQFQRIMNGVSAAIQPALKSLGALGKLIFDVLTFNTKELASDWDLVKKSVVGFGEETVKNFKAAEANTKLSQDLAKRERTWSEQRLKLLKEFEDAKIMAGKRSALDDAGKEKAAKKALEINELIYLNDLKIAKNKSLLIEREQAMNSKKDYQAITDAHNKVQEIINAHSREQLTVGNLLGKTEQRIEAGNKAEILSGVEKSKKIIEARRKLIDMENSLMEDSKEKELKISNEKFTREIEDSKATGDLLNKILTAQKDAADEIENKYAIKSLSDNIKADELTLDNMKKAGQDTLNFEKEILKDKMKAEIMAGGSIEEIKKKYRFLEIDLEQQNSDKKIALFEKEIAKQSELLSSEYKQKELNLKKDFSKTKQTEDDKAKYEHDLAKLKLDSLLETNNKTIELLNKELEMSGLSADKKAELSKKLADLQIENENAVTDATIKNNEDRVKADKDAIAKRIEVAEALGNATQEIFGAIANYVTQQSEQRVTELEKEQEASDKNFEAEQGNLDNAIMSDENRAEKQKALNEKKAASEKVIADKIQAEKIKQAKWEKANAIVQAIITAGLSILKASLAPPPLGLISAGLAATMAAIQVATIISQPIPAYAKGTENHPGGLSLWGEVQPEIAVTPMGDAFLAEKPTLTNFDAGTKIYKSVSDYENFIAKQAVSQMVFDYDKFGEKMPQNNIILDSSGLWSIVSKQNSRRTLINRRYSNR